MEIGRGIGFVLGLARPAAHQSHHIHDVIVRFIELCLREVWKQAIVAAVTIHNDDLLATVARHLIGGLLQQLELKSRTVSHRAWFVLRLKNLPEIIFRKNDRVFLLRRIQRRVAHVQQIVAQRQMRSMFLQDAERQQTHTLTTRNGIAELSRAQLLPMG